MGHANDIASLADDAIERLKLDLEAIVEALRGYLKSLLEKASVDADGKLFDSSANTELAAKLEADFSRTLRDLGYDQTMNRLLLTFEQVADANDAHLANTLGASLSSANREALGAFVNGVADELVHLEGEAGKKLRELVLLGATTHVPREALLEDLVHAAGVTLREAVTEADTSIMAFHREALQSSAEDAGFDLFTYEGPDDAIIRPFCAEHVGRIYTTGDLDQEENGQGLWPTSRFLGGYNCRHSLMPLTVDEAKAMVERDGARAVGGPEARRIVNGGRAGPNEAAFVEQFAGQVVTRQGRQRVVRRRRAA